MSDFLCVRVKDKNNPFEYKQYYISVDCISRFYYDENTISTVIESVDGYSYPIVGNYIEKLRYILNVSTLN